MSLRVVVDRGEGLPPVPELSDVRAALARAVRGTLRSCEVEDAEISLALLNDREITELNRRWLHRDRPTDVIAFALHAADEAPLGDVYIGVGEALRQAEAHHVPPREELVRLAIHGTLHVLGYDHPEGVARETSEMWALQERLVESMRRP